MEFTYRKDALGAALGTAFLGLGMVGGAHAASYAVGIDRLDNFQIVGSVPDSLSLTSGTRTATGSVLFGGSPGVIGNAVTNPPALTTYGEACSGPNCTPGIAPSLVPTLGSTPAGLALAPTDYQRSSTTLNYARADAYAIGNPLGTGAIVRSLSETSRNTPGAASGDAVDSLTGNLQATLVLGTAQNITLQFSASKDLGVSVTSPGGTANASIHDVFTAQCAVGNSSCVAGTIMFQFSPNGAIGPAGNVNGTAEVDPFSLNEVIGTANIGGSVNDVNSGRFSLTTLVPLAAGNYDISLNKNSHSDVFVMAVPEPESMLLVGSALVALGFTSRRRKIK